MSLLDIHVAPSMKERSSLPACQNRLEILEAGTGHGALTLHLARAIAGANPPPPACDAQAETEEWTNWRASRGSVIHTVELNPAFQAHAEKLIKGFRQGLYWPHIDFHVFNVGDWVRMQVVQRTGSAFLDHVLLDLPGVHKQIPAVVEGMKDDSKLLVFVPSVTQLGDCVREIERLKLPLVMDKVFELGEGISNGRVWDVKLVTTKKAKTDRPTSEPCDSSSFALGHSGRSGEIAEKSDTRSSPGETEGSEDEDTMKTEERDQGGEVEADDSAGERVLVCRPKVGRMTVGGGFVGMWRRQAARSNTTPK